MRRPHYMSRFNQPFSAFLSPLLIFTIFSFVSLFYGNSALAQERELNIGDTSLTIQIIPPGEGSKRNIKLISQPGSTALHPIARIIWLPSEYGVLFQEKALAEQLAKQGFESWFVDYYEAMFLSPTPSAVDKVNPEWTARIIQEALKQSNQQNVPLWIIAPNKAAQLAVKGLQKIFTRPGKNMGLVLINPNLYIQTPSPGLTAKYWPEASNINLPITVIQSELSPWKLNMAELNQHLSQAGSDVFTQLITDVRDRFYFRPDALPIEQAKTLKLAGNIMQAMRLQLPYMQQQRSVTPLLAQKTMQKIQNSVKHQNTTELNQYKGAQGLPLVLNDIHGQLHNLTDYKGKVVLLNFWASWCPPCVHEMPSMARLKTHFKNEPFEILAANLGEDPQQVKRFLEQHPVNFPVLFDKGSQAAKEWKVFAYPSSYLIDKEGKVRFALFGGTEWDNKEHIDKINLLLQ